MKRPLLVRTPILPAADKAADQRRDDALGTLTEALQQIPILDGKLLTGVRSPRGVLSDGIDFGAGQDLSIAHGLGRPWRGWFVARAYGGGGLSAPRLRESSTQPPNPDLLLSLYAVDACRVWLWVY